MDLQPAVERMTLPALLEALARCEEQCAIAEHAGGVDTNHLELARLVRRELRARENGRPA